MLLRTPKKDTSPISIKSYPVKGLNLTKIFKEQELYKYETIHQKLIAMLKKSTSIMNLNGK